MDFVTKFGILFIILFAVVNGRAVPEKDECRCDLRFHRHYEIRSCQVNQTDSCGCPTSYRCPPVGDESLAQKNVCVYQGVDYKVGSQIRLEDTCQRCRCLGATPRIVCRHTECPQLDPVDGENCHPVFEKNKCCPSRYECVDVDEETDSAIARTDAVTCTYENVSYPLGAKIYSLEDPCQVCLCEEEWNGMDNSTCYFQECVYERHKHYLETGCIPVYHESKCCPIEYYCPGDNAFNTAAENASSNGNTSYSDDDNPGTCWFDGSSYVVGEQIATNNSCVRCDCLVPPDVTCVHQSCPPSPNFDHCFEFYAADQCCPVYDCTVGESTIDEDSTTPTYIHPDDCPTPMCADSSCIIGVLYGHTCPTCICEDGCPTPVCVNESCRVDILTGEKCPRCICDEPIEENDLEPADMTVESPNIEVKDDKEGENEISVDEVSHEVNDLEMDDASPAQEHSEDGDPENVSREFLSEAFIKESEKEKNLLEHILKEDSEERQPKSAFQTDKDENSEVLLDPETGSPDYNSTPEELTTNRSSNEIRRKRSANSQTGVSRVSQNQWTVLQQEQGAADSAETSERETENGGEDVDTFDEVKLFGSRESRNYRPSADMLTLEEAEYNNVIWRTTVPGCPTPMCADSTCRIGIPPGRNCPTCVCKRRRQP